MVPVEMSTTGPLSLVDARQTIRSDIATTTTTTVANTTVNLTDTQTEIWGLWFQLSKCVIWATWTGLHIQQDYCQIIAHIGPWITSLCVCVGGGGGAMNDPPTQGRIMGFHKRYIFYKKIKFKSWPFINKKI